MTAPELPKTVRPQDAVLFYDGLCVFCDGIVSWFIRHDVEHDGFNKLYFAAQQSELGQTILTRHGVNVISDGTAYLLIHPGTSRERLLTRSAAILHAIAMFGGIWAVLASLVSVLPRRMNDAAYALLARHRYEIAGKLTTCRVPSPQERSRFLDLASR
jgi:predicted DCC family thiol-disulfide oxidoreductase YuxK